jgi:hypothetical protein
MKVFSTVVSAFVATLAMLAGIAPASASTLDWTVTGTSISGAGTLTTGTEYSPGIFGVTGVTGVFADTNSSVSGVVSYPFNSNGVTQTSPDGLYYYDNLFYSIPGQTMFNSTGGLLFLVGGGATFPGGAEVNIAGDGGSGYQLWETTQNAQYLPGSGAGYAVEFNASAPEPASFALLGAGLIVLGLVRRKRA